MYEITTVCKFKKKIACCLINIVCVTFSPIHAQIYQMVDKDKEVIVECQKCPECVCVRACMRA